MAEKQQNIRVSVVIATYNRGEYLTGTLDTLAAQTLPAGEWELVVVNNNSTDDTAAVYTAFASAHHEMNARMVEETSQGLSFARNRGIAESCGEYIVIIDDDEEVNPEFLEVYCDFFDSHADVAAAGGRIVAKFTAVAPRWMSPYAKRAIAGTLDLGNEPRPFPKSKFFGGGNMAVRRSALDKYGLFNTDLGRTGKKLLAGEEKDLYLRLAAGGEQAWYLPGAVIWHLIPAERLTGEYFRRLTLQIGRSERVRTLSISRAAYAKRLFTELIKWCGALVITLGYLLALRPSKGWYLLVMRRQITRGLLSSK